jgi:hypothetical protein
VTEHVIVTNLRERLAVVERDRDAACAEVERLHAELKRVRRLLLTALDCWAVEAEMGPHEPGRQRARDQIAQLRERGGLT